MKVFFDSIAVLDQEYQEILIDDNNFKPIEYKPLIEQSLNIHGVMYNNIYILEPLNYYKIILTEADSFMGIFVPANRLIEAGLIFSGFNSVTTSIFVYNSTHNHIYIKADTSIGEIK